MAKPIPVLPLVASITVCPGLRVPVFSACSITPSASLSLTELMGLNASDFTYRLTPGGASLLILMTGVLPIVLRMFSWTDAETDIKLPLGNIEKLIIAPFLLLYFTALPCLTGISIQNEDRNEKNGHHSYRAPRDNLR